MAGFPNLRGHGLLPDLSGALKRTTACGNG